MREFASFESRNRRTGLKEQGCFRAVLGSETVCPQVQFAATPRILNLEFWEGGEGEGEGSGV